MEFVKMRPFWLIARKAGFAEPTEETGSAPDI
jgi:hypothetical protein